GRLIAVPSVVSETTRAWGVSTRWSTRPVGRDSGRRARTRTTRVTMSPAGPAPPAATADSASTFPGSATFGLDTLGKSTPSALAVGPALAARELIEARLNVSA